MPAPHLIVAGLRLRGFTGIELMHGLRASDWAAPVLLIARPGDERLLEDGDRLGAHAILRWPFSIEAFRDAVRDLCSVDDWPPALRVDQPIETRADA
jgi:DNA-binding NarL/FixJ family response regulator